MPHHFNLLLVCFHSLQNVSTHWFFSTIASAEDRPVLWLWQVKQMSYMQTLELSLALIIILPMFLGLLQTLRGYRSRGHVKCHAWIWSEVLDESIEWDSARSRKGWLEDKALEGGLDGSVGHLDQMSFKKVGSIFLRHKCTDWCLYEREVRTKASV